MRVPELSPQTTLAALLAWTERHAWLLLGAMTALYSLIFSVAAVYKLHAFWMGFDLGVHEQAIWNTAHGRIAAVSMFGTTDSYLGIDIILVELLLALPYALLPRTETLLVLQVTLAATGTVPLFLLARARTGAAIYGLVAALLYCALLPVQHAILYEFQIRTLGTVFLLWAVWFYDRERLGWMLAAGALAMGTRSDAGLALAMLGLVALVQRRGWPWVLLPGALGLGWVLLAVRVLIPAFRTEHDFLYTLIYAWLGDTPGEMLHTLLTRPGYVLGNVLTPGKLAYLLELFGPLLLVPLLRPVWLLPALPLLAINLISLDRIHWSVRYHYQAFVIPFLLMAVVCVLGSPWAERRRWRRPALAAALVAAALVTQLWLRSPLINLATRPRDDARIAVAHELLAQVPPDAALSITSTLGPHAARRQQLYFFPGNVIYPPALATQGEYLLADTTDVADALPRLRALQQSPAWETLDERAGFVLLRRATP